MSDEDFFEKVFAHMKQRYGAGLTESWEVNRVNLFLKHAKDNFGTAVNQYLPKEDRSYSRSVRLVNNYRWKALRSMTKAVGVNASNNGPLLESMEETGFDPVQIFEKINNYLPYEPFLEQLNEFDPEEHPEIVVATFKLPERASSDSDRDSDDLD
jgi:hypothetical protein